MYIRICMFQTIVYFAILNTESITSSASNTEQLRKPPKYTKSQLLQYGKIGSISCSCSKLITTFVGGSGLCIHDALPRRSNLLAKALKELLLDKLLILPVVFHTILEVFLYMPDVFQITSQIS